MKNEKINYNNKFQELFARFFFFTYPFHGGYVINNICYCCRFAHFVHCFQDNAAVLIHGTILILFTPTL